MFPTLLISTCVSYRCWAIFILVHPSHLFWPSLVLKTEFQVHTTFLCNEFHHFLLHIFLTLHLFSLTFSNPDLKNLSFCRSVNLLQIWDPIFPFYISQGKLEFISFYKNGFNKDELFWSLSLTFIYADLFAQCFILLSKLYIIIKQFEFYKLFPFNKCSQKSSISLTQS